MYIRIAHHSALVAGDGQLVGLQWLVGGSLAGNNILKLITIENISLPLQDSSYKHHLLSVK